MDQIFFDRDLSWLSFNERVLQEAGKEEVPLLERINFLSIYSSNLDEFYRVRIPALMALQNIKKEKKNREKAAETLYRATVRIHSQQELFGVTLTQQIIPLLKENGIHLLYNEPIPDIIRETTRDHFFSNILAFIQILPLSEKRQEFFPGNNQLYIAATYEMGGKDRAAIINIPSTQLARFFEVEADGMKYVVFTDDIIRDNLEFLFPGATIDGAYSFKITRDAELDLQDEFEGDIAEKIERQIAKRDLGFATRFLYSPGIPDHLFKELLLTLNLSNASIMEGGNYHNLKDLASFPVKAASLSYPKWPAGKRVIPREQSLFQRIAAGDMIIHTPYQDYSTVLRFFNEAAINREVEEIYITLYRMAGDSRIATALISAARNGKSVTVFVELKARFDEANNIRWAKKMKEAGIRIIYSIPGLKVHAKVVLIKMRPGAVIPYYGLLSTGNFNESTARFYTDHILMTAKQDLLRELDSLFVYLARRKKPDNKTDIDFRHLLVAQFNLQDRFLELIDREIVHARMGKPAQIFIKLNNLEERVMIRKLYEASEAGVTINLLVRSICRLVPGIGGLSQNIRIKRIVDRYLEHGRIFWFHNDGNDEVFAGSSDWMERNIYRRIEVCFPILDPKIREELIDLIEIAWSDNVQAVMLDEQLNNMAIVKGPEPIRSQELIYQKMNNHA